MPGRNLNLVDVLTALGQGVIEDIPADPNEVVNNLLSDCEHVGVHEAWCCKGVRLIGGPFLWDSALWNYANWDGAFNQFVAVPQPGYVNSVLTDRPYAYYRLDENVACFGSKVIDSSGGVHDGVASGSITYNVPGALAGDPDTAMSFNTTGTVSIPNFVGWAFIPSTALATPYDSPILYDSHLVYDGTGTTNQTTVELWINLASLPVANVTVFGVPTVYSLQVTPSGHISLGNESGGTIVSSGVVAVGTYSHIVGIINASTSALTINGNSDVSGAVSIPTGSSAGTARIAIGLNAIVDEVAIYDKTLTTARIQAHYNARAVQVGKAGENTKISTTYSAITLPALLWGGSASTSFWAGGGGSRNAWG